MADPGFYAIPESYPRTWSNVFEQVIQQQQSRFMGSAKPDAKWTAKEHIFRDLSKNNWARNDTRGGTTVARESQTSFRKGYKKKVEAEAIEFYEWDRELLDSIVLPTGEETQAMNYGWQRMYDDLFIEAAFENSLGGVEPYNTSTAFPASQSIAVNYGTPAAPVAGSNQSLTPWKLIRAMKMFRALDIDMDREEPCIAASPDEFENMLYYSSTYYSEWWATSVGKWLNEWQSGNKAAKLLGFTAIETNRLTVTSGTRDCIAYLRSGFVSSAATDIKMTMDRIPQDKNKLLLQGSAMVGICRRYDEKVIKVPCAVLT